MPVNGLPSALEDLLIFLLSKNCIKSWNYFGQSSGTTLTIKWTDNNEEDATESPEFCDSVSYRRKSVAQISRDSRRAKEWKKSKMELNSQNYPDDVLENKSEILTANSSDLNQAIGIDSHDALPFVSAENASPPHMGKVVASTPGLQDIEPPSIDIPADMDVSDKVHQPLLGSERTSSYPKFTDDCSKCKDIRYHTGSTDHDTAMKQLHKGPPFHRKCMDCNSAVFDTSKQDWKYKLDKPARLCNYCSPKSLFFPHFVCESCVSNHKGHSITEGVFRLHLQKNKKSGRYDFGPVIMSYG